MIDWNKIVESNVIKTFREVSHKWWGMDIQFYDEYGNWINDNINFNNPLCSLINKTPKGRKNCHRCYSMYLRDLKKHHGPFIYDCYAGLKGVIMPITVKEMCVGTMICSGMKLPNGKCSARKMHIQNITRLGIDKTLVEQGYNNLKTVNEHSEEYALDFVELIAKDVITFYAKLLEKKDIIKKQGEIQEMLYNKKYKSIIGKSPAIRKTINTIELIEGSESPVLLEGETGTGKELLAAAIHYNSLRKDKMFVIQNCLAFSDTILNSELFGHEEGSFTGAIREKKGLFEIADGGTLFLDEVGDMNIDLQVKLLRILEDGTFYRVGGTDRKKVDVRIIVATNKTLKKLVEQDLFRRDLFYRINTIPITLPPLRERRDDIVLLLNYFFNSYMDNYHIEKKEISQAVIDSLIAYDWPGNIRELKNTIERLIILSGEDKTIELRHLPNEIKGVFSPVPNVIGSNNGKLKESLISVEKEIIEATLKMSKWNKTAASRELGISRATLNNKIEQFNILQCLA